VPVVGCKVIATAGSEEKRRICKERGWADEAVDYTKDGWQVGIHVPHGLKRIC